MSTLDKSKKKILVAEDERTLQRMLVMILEDEDYQVDAVANGGEAWELMNKNHYDLLITDMFMPEINGLELTLKCQESFPAIKIILTSGGGNGLEAKHGKRRIKFRDQEVEVDMFLQKPWDIDELFPVVERLLQE